MTRTTTSETPPGKCSGLWLPAPVRSRTSAHLLPAFTSAEAEIGCPCGPGSRHQLQQRDCLRMTRSSFTPDVIYIYFAKNCRDKSGRPSTSQGVFPKAPTPYLVTTRTVTGGETWPPSSAIFRKKRRSPGWVIGAAVMTKSRSVWPSTIMSPLRPMLSTKVP